MEKFINNDKPSQYDTSINVIGGLNDCGVILKSIDSFFNQTDSVKELVCQRNEFNLRTEKSRERIERALRRTFLQFVNSDHRDLIKEIFKDDVPLKDKELVLLWQYALNNSLFRDITCSVFVKTYFSGRAVISKDDILAYLVEILSHSQAIDKKWSRNTIDTLSTKYLSLMSKLNLLNPGRIKSFRLIKPSSEALILFLYFAKLYDPTGSNLFSNHYSTLCFVNSQDLIEKLKKLSIKGFFNMNYNGIALNIELTHSYKGICDVLYNRSQTEI